MNEYLIALIYIGLGVVGSTLHYGKKRYVDFTTNDSLKKYLLSNLPTTVYTLSGIILAEINLSLLQTTGSIGLGNVIGAMTLGFTADSAINRASEAPVVVEAVKLVKEGVIPVPES